MAIPDEMIERAARAFGTAVCAADTRGIEFDDLKGSQREFALLVMLAALEAAGVGELIARLTGASHALRSYQYGNSSTELAEGQADAIDAALAKIGVTP